MTSAPTLAAGLEVSCPHCRQWHRVEQPYADHSTAEHQNLDATCPTGRYLVGQIGHPGRWLTRASSG